MILLTLSRGKGEETVRLQLPASPAEIGETFAFLTESASIPQPPPSWM